MVCLSSAHSFFLHSIQKERMVCLPSACSFSTIDAERKDGLCVLRSFFLSASIAERKHKWTADRPSFFLHWLQKENTSGRQTDHPFLLQSMQKERTTRQLMLDNKNNNNRDPQRTVFVNSNEIQTTYLEWFWQPSCREQVYCWPASHKLSVGQERNHWRKPWWMARLQRESLS